jgi:hypothetical protein
MFILVVIAYCLAFFGLVACSLPDGLKQNILDDSKSFLEPDETLKLEMLKADQLETVMKLIYSRRLTVGTGNWLKLSYSVSIYGKILNQHLQNTIGEPQYKELMKIVEKIIDYYTIHGFGPTFSEKFYQVVLNDYKSSVVTLSPSTFGLALKLNDLFDEINFHSRPLYKLFNEDKHKGKNRFYLCNCRKNPTVEEQNDCIKGVLEYAGIPSDQLQNVNSILDIIYPKWKEFGKIHKAFISAPAEEEVGKVIKKETESITEAKKAIKIENEAENFPNVLPQENKKPEEVREVINKEAESVTEDKKEVNEIIKKETESITEAKRMAKIENETEIPTNFPSQGIKKPLTKTKKMVKVKNEAENPTKVPTQENKNSEGLPFCIKITLMITIPLFVIICFIVIIKLVKRRSLHSVKNP